MTFFARRPEFSETIIFTAFRDEQHGCTPCPKLLKAREARPAFNAQSTEMHESADATAMLMILNFPVRDDTSKSPASTS